METLWEERVIEVAKVAVSVMYVVGGAKVGDLVYG